MNYATYSLVLLVKTFTKSWISSVRKELLCLFSLFNPLTGWFLQKLKTKEK